MAYIELFSVESFKFVLYSIIFYLLYVHLLKDAILFARIFINSLRLPYYPASFFSGHMDKFWPGFPFPTKIETVQRNFYELLNKHAAYNKDKSLTVLWISWIPLVFASNHEAVEILFRKKNLKKPYHYKYMGIGDGLISSDPELWKVRRKLIEPFFSTKKLRNHVKTMNQEVESFSRHLDSKVGKPVDLEHQIHTSTLNIILKTTASIPLDDSIEDKKTIIELVNGLEAITLKRVINPILQKDWLFKLFAFSKDYYKHFEKIQAITDVFGNRRKELLSSQPSDAEEDFIASLEGKVHEQGMYDELVTLIGAGHETTAVGLRWLLFNIGNHPEVQEQLYQEIISFFPDDTPTDDMDKINECTYLDQCIKESLRISPPVHGIIRVVEEDMMVKDNKLVKGTLVSAISPPVHRDPEVYPEPEKFDPNRWSPENASKIPKSSYIPFGYGPRICIGYRYAILELKIYTIQILRKFSLKSAREHGSIPIKAGITLNPMLPLEIIMTPRNNNH